MRRYVVQPWEAGWNLRGCLPEPGIVLHGASVEHAADYITGEIAQAGDWSATEVGARAYTKAWETVLDWNLPELERLARVHGDNHLTEWGVFVDNYWYWVRPCLIVNCDQVKTEEN